MALVIEDGLELIPPLLFVITTRIRKKPPTPKYPYGFHRVVTLGFFGSALALLAFGVVIFALAVQSLLQLEHPTIGSREVFGERVWQSTLAVDANRLEDLYEQITGLDWRLQEVLVVPVRQMAGQVRAQVSDDHGGNGTG